MDIHKDIDDIKAVAFNCAKEHGCNYTIIIHNPVEGNFDKDNSTYEFVADTWFEKERPEHVVVCKTDDLMMTSDGYIKKKNKMRKIGMVGNHVGLVASLDKIMEENKSNVYTITANEFIEDDTMFGHQSKKQKEAIVVPVRTEAKIGRNEPCYCGSGKKFKKCCK